MAAVPRDQGERPPARLASSVPTCCAGDDSLSKLPNMTGQASLSCLQLALRLRRLVITDEARLDERRTTCIH